MRHRHRLARYLAERNVKFSQREAAGFPPHQLSSTQPFRLRAIAFFLWVLAASLLIGTTGFAEVQRTQPHSPQFEVASIRVSRRNNSWGMRFTPDGLIATNVSLKYLLEEAFGVFDNDLFLGGPAHLLSTTFTIQAKFSTARFPHPTLADRRKMLLDLLKARFGFKYHFEMRKMHAYAVKVANLKKLRTTTSQGRDAVYGNICHWIDARPGLLRGRGCTMGDLAFMLTNYMQSGYQVVDQTGLAGRFDFDLSWSIDHNARYGPAESQNSDLFSALHQELGLVLEGVRAPMRAVSIDHIAMPSAN